MDGQGAGHSVLHRSRDSSFLILRKNFQLELCVALLCAGSMWFYVQCVLIPYQKADAVLHERPRGNLSDLYPRWLGARELLLHHRNPYGNDVAIEIQKGYYGRELDPAGLTIPRTGRDLLTRYMWSSCWRR